MIAFFKSIMLSDQMVGTTTHQFALNVLAAVCGSIALLWFWFLGTSLNEIVRPDLRQNARVFVVAFVLSEVYLVVLFISVQSPRVLSAIAPLALIGTVCIFYMTRFVARALVLAETNKDPKSSEYVLTFLLLCFFPLGIWVLQPRINQLYTEKGKGG